MFNQLYSLLFRKEVISPQNNEFYVNCYGELLKIIETSNVNGCMDIYSFEKS